MPALPSHGSPARANTETLKIVNIVSSETMAKRERDDGSGSGRLLVQEADARMATAREQGLVIHDPRPASHDGKRARR